MDEAVARHAKLIEVTLDADGYLTVKDDSRGMPPVDPHPKHPGKSALEVITDHPAFRQQISAARPMRPPAACTGSASAWSTPPCRNILKPPSGATAIESRQDFAHGKPASAPIRQGKASRQSTAPPSASNPTRKSSARTSPFAPRASTAWPARRPTCSAAARARARVEIKSWTVYAPAARTPPPEGGELIRDTTPPPPHLPLPRRPWPTS